MRKIRIISILVAVDLVFSIFFIGFHLPVNNLKTRVYDETMISYEDYNNATNASFTHDSQGILYTAWDEVDVNRRQVHLSVSYDDGVTWSGQDKDNPVTSEEFDATQPSVRGGKEKTVYLVWSEHSSVTGDNEIFFQKSTDGGVSWVGRSQITKSFENGKNFEHPMLSNDTQGILYGVWNGVNPYNNYHQAVYFGYSQDDGSTWSSTERAVSISNESINSDASRPFILVSRRGGIFVFWTKYIEKYNSTEVFVSYSKDGGTTWDIEQISYTDSNTNAYNVTATEYRGYIYAFWEQEVSEKRTVREIVNSYYDDSSWSGVDKEKLISYPDGKNAYHPSACANTTKIMVIWSEFDENTEYIQLMISNSSDGSVWTGSEKDMVITSSLSDHLEPVSLVSNKNLHVIWNMWASYGKPRGSMEIFTLSSGQVPEFSLPVLLIVMVVVFPFIKRIT